MDAAPNQEDMASTAERPGRLKSLTKSLLDNVPKNSIKPKSVKNGNNRMAKKNRGIKIGIKSSKITPPVLRLMMNSGPTCKKIIQTKTIPKSRVTNQNQFTSKRFLTKLPSRKLGFNTFTANAPIQEVVTSAITT